MLNMEFKFTEQDFKELRSMVTNISGIELTEQKKNLMYSRLSRRLRHLNLESFTDYCSLIKTQTLSGNDSEMMMLINAMTTNVTHFFREKHHFTHLSNHLDEMVKKNGKVRIWSCASSIGAEPWSIAMTVQEYLMRNPTADIKIIATDIDTTVLGKAREGVYEISDEEFIEHPILKKYMEKVPDSDKSLLQQHTYRIKDSIRSLVTFEKANLIETFPNFLEPEYHFVFCRNVIIYFSKDTQRALFKQISKKIPQDGFLYIGHSENLFKVSEDFHAIGQTTYEKSS